MNAPTHPAPAASTEKTRKSPAEFNEKADQFNADLAARMTTLANVQKAIDEHMAARDTLIASAKDYGLTASYARTLLRKA